ncbi:hypothetical protein NDU88_007025 [Pleurodeles waltl]|uniref:Uncharacterized protein n=1 Tax=Pleurodeles waltl TaxID=8319 RepID=A0AAV7U094_PLEWA|nr:hypothetical protein NDU88_007025 [Pleurodeles waltl]
MRTATRWVPGGGRGSHRGEVGLDLGPASPSLPPPPSSPLFPPPVRVGEERTPRPRCPGPWVCPPTSVREMRPQRGPGGRKKHSPLQPVGHTRDRPWNWIKARGATSPQEWPAAAVMPRAPGA